MSCTSSFHTHVPPFICVIKLLLDVLHPPLRAADFAFTSLVASNLVVKRQSLRALVMLADEAEVREPAPTASPLLYDRAAARRCIAPLLRVR